LAESGLTSLMVLHDFLSRRLTPLQDRATRPAWMYTGVNDIMRLERGLGSSLDGELLAACLKVLTTDQFSAELVTPPASCGAICMDQAARTALLVAMPTLDDVDITVVQRGDLSRGVTIPGATVTGDRGGTTGGGRRGRGPGSSGSPRSAPALNKGKGVSTRVIHDDDKVSSDEDEPLQVRLRSRFPAGGSSSPGTTSPVAVAAEAGGAEAATYRRAAEEVVAKEVAGKGSSVPGQVPSSAAGAKRAATPSGSSPPAKRPYRDVWRPRYVPKSLRHVSFSFCEAHYFSFPSSRPPPAPRAPSVATVASSAAPAAGATVPAVAAEVVPELVTGGMPQTPEGVPEDVPESPTDALEVVPSPSPVEVLAEEATLVVRTAVPSSPLAAAAVSSSALGTATPVNAAADAVGETEVVMGHPTYHAPGDISLDRAVSTALRALSQVLRREDGDLADERRCLQLWASMLKETTVTERAEARRRQRGFDLQAEAIELRDADSRRALTEAQELYASAEARTAVVIKQEEDLAARTRQVNQRAREVEELQRRLLEREELDEITLRRELEALGTRESGLDSCEAELDREREGLKDASVQILARELDADAREAGLRDQEARLAARERQLAERQMQELAVVRKGLEDLQASRAGDA
jgi:hypothetical protein